MIHWTKLWLKLFGTTTWMNVNVGFWISIGFSTLVAFFMIVLSWSVKPYRGKGN